MKSVSVPSFCGDKHAQFSLFLKDAFPGWIQRHGLKGMCGGISVGYSVQKFAFPWSALRVYTFGRSMAVTKRLPPSPDKVKLYN